MTSEGKENEDFEECDFRIGWHIGMRKKNREKGKGKEERKRERKRKRKRKRGVSTG